MVKLIANYKSDLGLIKYFSQITFISATNQNFADVIELLPVEIQREIREVKNDAIICNHPDIKRQRQLKINNENIIITCPLPFVEIDFDFYLENSEISNVLFVGERVDNYAILYLQ